MIVVLNTGRRGMANPIEKVIYSPPKDGLPHLVVTIAKGEVVDSVAVASRDAARATIAEETPLIRKAAEGILTH